MIGERLAEIRKDHNDTQKDLAEKMNVVVHTVSSWEQEKSEPNHEMLVKICRLYSVSADYLLGLSDVDPAYIRRRAGLFEGRGELPSLEEAEKRIKKEGEHDRVFSFFA